MSGHCNDKIYFATLKESRSDYFVEYQPPRPGLRFAMLSVVFVRCPEKVAIAQLIEKESAIWHDRFPVPIMASAFDEAGGLVHLDGIRPDSHLVAFANSETGEFKLHWRQVRDEEMPSQALSRQFMLDTYAGVDRKSQSDCRAEAVAHRKQLRLGWLIVFVWAAVAPAAFLVLEFFGPRWLAILIFVYGLYKALRLALRMLGKWKPSTSELEKAEEERLMRHHHYHCKLNPEGFLRLKLDNFEREQREEIKREAEAPANEKSGQAGK